MGEVIIRKTDKYIVSVMVIYDVINNYEIRICKIDSL